jgi:tetratricopeptide (TPR) repeat protein
MTSAEDTWTFHNMPYTGPFIDYYYSGRKQREGRMLNGKVTGRHTFFYQNGNIQVERDYEDGYANGWDKEYYSNGSLKQSGRFVHGKEEGVWEDYFPNGSIRLRSNYRGGTLEDSAVTYYSNGRVKERVLIKNGKAIADQAHTKINQLMAKSKENDQGGDRKAAIKYCTKVIELDSTYADAYFSRGTLKLNDFQFDEAIADFDKALTIEPFMAFALSNRAFARIRKYQFGNSRQLSKNSEMEVRASSDKVPVPPEDQVKICNDLQAAISLDDRSAMILEAVQQYCH